MAFLLSINKLQCKDNCFFLHLQVNLSESYLWLGYFNPLPAALTHCPEGISLSRYILWFLSQRIGINDAAAGAAAAAGITRAARTGAAAALCLFEGAGGGIDEAVVHHTGVLEGEAVFDGGHQFFGGGEDDFHVAYHGGGVEGIDVIDA